MEIYLVKIRGTILFTGSNPSPLCQYRKYCGVCALVGVALFDRWRFYVRGMHNRTRSRIFSFNCSAFLQGEPAASPTTSPQRPFSIAQSGKWYRHPLFATRFQSDEIYFTFFFQGEIVRVLGIFDSPVTYRFELLSATTFSISMTNLSIDPQITPNSYYQHWMCLHLQLDC